MVIRLWTPKSPDAPHMDRETLEPFEDQMGLEHGSVVATEISKNMFREKYSISER